MSFEASLDGLVINADRIVYDMRAEGSLCGGSSGAYHRCHCRLGASVAVLRH
jgi:hypothetical protein